MSGIRKIKHDFESIILDSFFLFPIVVHNFIEVGLIVDGSLRVVFIVFR